MLLRVGIEFVIVAARALDGGTGEGVERVAHHFIPINVAGDAAINLTLRYFDMPDKIPRTGGNEAKPKNAVGRAGEERIAGNLFLDEPRVRFVFVERTNNIIAIRPGVGPQLVLVVPAGVGVLHHIEPVPAPAFAVARAGEQSVGQCGDGLITIGFRRLFKRRNLRGSGRQAGEVEGHAPDQGEGIGLGGGAQSMLGLFGADKLVDGIARPFLFGGGEQGQGRAFQWLERPVLLPLCALGDPLAEGGDLRGGKWFAALGWGHAFFGVDVGNAFEQILQNRPGGLFGIQSQLGFAGAGVGPVAGVAIGGEDGPHVTIIPNRCH